MSKNKLSIEVYSIGETLSECVRVCLHSSNPSAMLKRIAAGIEAFEAEASVRDDRELAGVLRAGILEHASKFAALEETLYNADSKPANTVPVFTRTYTPEDYDYDLVGRCVSDQVVSENNDCTHTKIDAAKTATISPAPIDAVRNDAYTPSDYVPVKDNELL